MLTAQDLDKDITTTLFNLAFSNEQGVSITHYPNKNRLKAELSKQYTCLVKLSAGLYKRCEITSIHIAMRVCLSYVEDMIREARFPFYVISCVHCGNELKSPFGVILLTNITQRLDIFKHPNEISVEEWTP